MLFDEAEDCTSATSTQINSPSLPAKSLSCPGQRVGELQAGPGWQGSGCGSLRVLTVTVGSPAHSAIN